MRPYLLEANREPELAPRAAQVLAHFDLHMLPAAARNALCLLSDPNCQLVQLIPVVKQDVKLATGILSLANSPIYCPSTPILDLRRAIVQIGFRKCKNLIHAYSMSGLLHQLADSLMTVGEFLVQHSFRTGTAASTINRIMGFGMDGEEFTAGLLHDVGRFLTGTILPESYADIGKLSFLDFDDTLVRETRDLGNDHTELGYWFGRRNHLPEQILDAIRWHHQPERSEFSPLLVAVTAAADHLASHVQMGGSSDDYSVARNRGLHTLHDLGKVSQGDLSDLAREVLQYLAGSVVG